MSEVCPKCKRPLFGPKDNNYVRTCLGPGFSGCDIAAAAYRRGVLRGVEIAERHATAPLHGLLVQIDWTEVHRIAAEEVGDGSV